MITKTVAQPALDIIQGYLHFRIGQADVQIPYFINSRTPRSASPRISVGKGSLGDIAEEIKIALKIYKIDEHRLSNEQVKNFFVEYGVGIDCSGYAYYVLDAHIRSIYGKGLDRILSYPYAGSWWRRLITKTRPIENTDVRTFSHDVNSRVVAIADIQPGDFISMLAREDSRNHISIIHKVEYQNNIPFVLHYTHSIATPYDGIGNTGVRTGQIELIASDQPIIHSRWTEGGLVNDGIYLYQRLKECTVTIRRIHIH